MATWLCALFSMIAGAPTQVQRDMLASLSCNWVLLNVRNGRYFIDICGPVEQLQNIRDYLTSIGRDPKVIAIFDLATDGGGNLVQQCRANPGFDSVEYLNVAPDVNTYNAQGVLVSSVRPTGYIETHRFAGWPAKAGTP
jgi:hypothetical protein